MKKRGFTLIELLGVIIVLSFLALITAPIIMNTIEKSKKASVLRSAEQIIRTATLNYTTNDNFTTEQTDVLSLDFDGKKPELGYIQFNINEKVRFYMVQDGYCVIKKYDSELIAIKLEDIDVCDWNYGTNLVNLEANNQFIYADNLSGRPLLDYKIYGNTVQNKYVEVVDLPDEYQQVDYVEGNGNQYIDTGVKPTNTTKAEVTFEITDSGLVPAQYILGSRSTSSSTIIFALSGGGSNKQLTGVFMGNAKKIDYTRVINTVYKNTLEVEYTEGSGYRGKFTYRDLKNGVNVDYNVPESDVVAYTDYNEAGVTEGSPNIFLFGFNKSNLHKGLRLYNSKIWDNGVLVRNFVPCYRKSDNIAGLYDMVEGKFYVSNGTNPFIKGNNVEEVKYDYLGIYDSGTGKYNIQVKINGKNLFDKSKYLKLEDYTISASYYSKNIPLSPTETYKVSINRYNDFDGKIAGFLLISDKPKVNDNYTSINHNNYPNISIPKFKYTTSNNGKLFIGHYSLAQDELDTIWTNTDVQIERGETTTAYEPYKEMVYNISLDAPLRCLGEVCDYIDFENQQVIRKIGISSGELYVLEIQQVEQISLPEITVYEGINNISVTSGDVIASKIQMVANKK